MYTADLIKETSEIHHGNVHSDAGDGYEIECPNCHHIVRFADCQWWHSECKCGVWRLEQRAVLDTDEQLQTQHPAN